MKISANKDPGGGFTIAFGDLTVTLDADEVRQLQAKLREATGAAPPADLLRRLVRRIKAANDPGIQALLGVAAEDDILILLKLGERDIGLRTKLYRNMSTRARALYQEDLAFKFKQGVPRDTLAGALTRLDGHIADLARDGALAFASDDPAGDPSDRPGPSSA